MLGAFVHHALDPVDAERVAAHLDDCIACQELVLAAVRAGVAAPQALSGSAVTGRAAVGPSARPPRQIGRYELRAPLGTGGMGVVYEAYDGELERAVALKVLRPELGDAPGFTDRLIRESRLMAKVAHPAVIAVYDVGREGDAVFIAMELIRGSTLTAWLARTLPAWSAAVAVFERAGHGLAAAHGAGIVHRDFKPDNVLIARDGGKIVVTDFGIAREAAHGWPAGDPLAAIEVSRQHPTATLELPMTTDGAVIGTPAYMAPEQFEGRAVDHRADIFAFSVSLWEAVFRARPFPGKSAAEIVAAMRQRPVIPAGAPRVPRRLVRALRKGLALAPHDRWPDLPALLGELAALRARRRRRWIAAGAAGVVGLAITAALVVARSEPPVDRCARGLAALAEAYNPALDAQLGAVLAHEPAIRDRVRTQLAAVASAWTATQHATCHADRDVAQDARTAACLDARRIELAGTVDDVIANGAAGARYAVALARLPGAPAACAAPGPGLLFARVPADRALRRQVTALRTALCDADDAYDQADFPRALATAERAVAASATIWPPLHAEALFSLGKIQQLGGDSKLANATLRDTAVEAERAHHDRIAALSWAQLAIDAVDAARALEYVAYAEAAADRIGRPAAVMARIVYVKGSTLASADRTDEAEVVLHQAIELAETIDTDDLPRAIGGLGLVYFNQGRYAEAATALRKAIAQLPRSESGQIIGEPAYFTSLAHALSNLGQTAEAEVEARRAIEIADRTLPETQLDRQITHLELAAILHDLDRNDDALAEATRAIAGIEKIHGTRSQPWANAVAFRAEILTDVERYQEAEPLFARACEVIAFTAGVAAIEYAECEIRHSVALDGLHRDAEALAKADLALALYLKLDGESHPATADSYRVRGIVHAALHHHRAAIADLERATALLTDVKADPGHLAIAKWRLGKERWADQPVRARAEIREALVLFETATASWSRERAKAAAWLASHDRAHPAR